MQPPSDRLLRGIGTVAVVLFAALTAVVTLQVVNRLVLHRPYIWSEEIARFLFFWVVLLGAAISVRRRRHFVLDVMPRRWREARGGARVLLALFPHACVLSFCVFLAVEGIVYVRAGLFRTATNSQINMAAVYLAIPLFAALAALFAAINLATDYRSLRGGRVTGRPPEAAE